MSNMSALVAIRDTAIKHAIVSSAGHKASASQRPVDRFNREQKSINQERLRNRTLELVPLGRTVKSHWLAKELDVSIPTSSLALKQLVDLGKFKIKTAPNGRAFLYTRVA